MAGTKAAGTKPGTRAAALAGQMMAICGAANVITDPLELRTYECDGLTSHRSVPALVVLPGAASEVRSSSGSLCPGCVRSSRSTR